MTRRHWLDMSPDERVAAVSSLGLPAYRARQVTTHLLKHLNDDPATWTDLPAQVRPVLAEAFLVPPLTDVRSQTGDDGWTVKTAWQASDGALVESVLMRYGSTAPGDGMSSAVEPVETGERATVCVSSQAGCGMGCPFCATGQGGLRRNLTPAEILVQVTDAARRLRAAELPGGSGRLSNVVFMGMGEPLANYRAVLSAVRTIVAPDGLGISARGVTISTVGLVPQMERLAAEGLPVTLAVSLHAPDDALRDELCPMNKRWSVAPVLDAARAYFDRTGRRVSIEYALIRDINDQAWRADALADELTARGPAWAHVNLIPLNPTPGSKWTASRRHNATEFYRRVEARGVPVTVRNTRGRDIDGACGQLVARTSPS